MTRWTQQLLNVIRYFAQFYN